MKCNASKNCKKMIVKYEKLHCISVICIAQQLENEIITVVDYKILYYYNFLAIIKAEFPS